jgi:hypothetical protein
MSGFMAEGALMSARMLASAVATLLEELFIGLAT